MRPQAETETLSERAAAVNAGRYSSHFEMKTVIVKIVALNTAVWSGLALGREGPAVAIGAAIGWNCSKLVRPRLVDLEDQRHAKRIDAAGEGGLTHTLVAAGAAGGFAAVFNAPLGGILYIFEEIAGPTGWSARATRGSLMCTMRGAAREAPARAGGVYPARSRTLAACRSSPARN